MQVFAPIAQKLGRALRGHQALESAARRVWAIEPASVEVTGPATFLERDLERVTALQEETTEANEERRIRGGSIEHAATLAYELSDAVLVSGHAYSGDWHGVFTPRAENLRLRLDMPFLRGEHALASTFIGNRYFGHFIMDDLPLDLLAQGLGHVVRTDDPMSPHQDEYRALADTAAEPVVAARFESLVVCQDFGQNRGKRERLAQLRERLTRRLPLARHAGVYLRRGDGFARRLVNEAEVEAYLTRQGFIVVDPMTHSVADILRLTHGVRYVVGVEGSQLCHVIFTMARGGAVVALTPADRFNNVTKDYTDATGLRYGFTVCPEAEGGYRVNLDALAEVMDRMAGGGE
jgi:capsular polysaccharide biosynthesis protein